jgi:hypothetical protein
MACSMAAHRVGDSAGAQIRDRLRGHPQELGHDLLAAAAFERRVPGECAKQGRAQAVYVRAGIGSLTSQHFWGGERRGCDDCASGGLESADDPGDTEVGQLRLPVVGEQNVGRFDVAVQNSGAVRDFERTVSPPGEAPHPTRVGHRGGFVSRATPAGGTA